MINRPRFYLIRTILLRLMGRELYERLMMWIKLGYWPHLRNPRTFNEKICHRKLFKPFPSSHILADKYRVRDFIEKRVGKEILNKLYYVGNNPDEIPFETLPEKFVVKINNGAGENLFVRDKNKITLDDIKKWHGQVTNSKMGYLSSELWYLDINEKILIEEFLEDPTNDVPPDYKFFCFNGKAVYMFIDFDRFTNHTRRFFDMDWNPQDFLRRFEMGPMVEKPKGFEKMKEISEKIAAGSDFMRVDLYNLDGDIRFGEITLSPGAGWGVMRPLEIDFKFGELWEDIEIDPTRFP